jgi:hypothetical protein
MLSSACADTTKLEAEVADLKRRVAQLEKGGVAKGAKAKAGKAKAGKAGKAKAGKAGKAGKAKAGKAKAPAGPKVVVELTGDATKVSLNNGKRGFSVPGAVPAGSYTIQAAFAGDAELADMGSLQVEAGSPVSLNCASATRTCTQP